MEMGDWFGFVWSRTFLLAFTLVGDLDVFGVCTTGSFDLTVLCYLAL